MKTVTLPPNLMPMIEQMSRDMAVPVEGLVNQAIFNWARLHGYAAPNATETAVPQTHLDPAAEAVPDLRMKLPKHEGPRPAVAHTEPVTAQVPVVDEPAKTNSSGLDWQVASGGSFGSEMTTPSMQRLRRVVLIVREQETFVTADRFIIGRDVSCNLTIEAPRISRQHVALHVGPELVELEDLNSSNGTWIDGERIARQALGNGDIFFLGDVEVRIEFRA